MKITAQPRASSNLLSRITNGPSNIECMIMSNSGKGRDVERMLLDCRAFQLKVSPVASAAFILSLTHVVRSFDCYDRRVHMLSIY